MERKFLTKEQFAELLRNNPSDNIYESQIKHWYLIYGIKVEIEVEESEEEKPNDETRDENVQDSERDE